MNRFSPEMINSIFNSLKLLSKSTDKSLKKTSYNVQCIYCNSIHVMQFSHLTRHSKTNAKGCRFCYNPQEKHGLSKHECYGTWYAIKQRCYNKKHEAFHRYGGRGITICDEWKNSLKNFINWAIKSKWKKDLEVDRIDNDDNYSPDNCRITTAIINNNNTSRNRRFFIDGENLTIAEGARKYNIKYTTLRERLNRGYTGEQAINKFNLNFKNNSVAL